MYWKKGVIILDILRGHVQFSIEEKIRTIRVSKKVSHKKRQTVKQRVQIALKENLVKMSETRDL